MRKPARGEVRLPGATPSTGRGMKPAAAGGRGGGKVGGAKDNGPIGSGAAKASTKGRQSKNQSSTKKAERVIERWRSIGEGKTGRKAQQSRRVQDRAKTWLIGLAPTAAYKTGPKKGQERPREETIKTLSKKLQDRKAIRRAGDAYKRTPISGVYGKMLTSGRLDQVRTRLNKRAAAREAYGYSGMAPNKIETSKAVLKRAREFAKNPRGNQKLSALSRPRPQQQKPSTAPTFARRPAPVAMSSTQSASTSKPRLSAFQQSDARYAKRKYGVHSTISNPGRKSQRSPRRALQTGERVPITGRTRKQIQRSYAKTITNKLFDNYNRGLTRNAGPKLRIRKQPLYDQFSLFGGSKTVSRTKATRANRRRR